MTRRRPNDVETAEEQQLRVEFLYDPDCPSHEEALARLREVMEEQHSVPNLVVEAMTSRDRVQKRRFLGSPTIRINGVDIDPGSEHRQDYALTCRAYVKADGRISPLPPRELIRDAFQRARSKNATRARSGHQPL
jgi:hypothetical protein